MDNKVGIYKVVTQLPFDLCPDAQLGDIVVSTCGDKEVPPEWIVLSTYSTEGGIPDLNQEVELPAIIIPKHEPTDPNIKYERVLLKTNQIWYPRINCWSYKEKKIISVKKNELQYRQPGGRAWGSIEGFIDWIIMTGATLTPYKKEY